MIISSLFPPNIIGGAEKIAFELAKLLSEEYEIVVVTLNLENVDSNYQIDKINVHSIALKNSYNPFVKKQGNIGKLKKILWHINDINNKKMAIKVENIIGTENPSIVMTHNITGFSVEVWNLVKKYELPIVHVLHDYYLICPKSTMYKNQINCESQCLNCKLFSFDKKSSSQNVDAVVGVSNFVLNKHIENGYFKNSIKMVINNALDFGKKEKSKTIVADHIVFGFIGRLADNKGIEELLNIFKTNFSDEKIYIAGTGDEKYVNDLKDKYASENIIFLGFTNPSDYYNMINVNIVPSQWNEPFGMVVIESFYTATPVIGAKRGGITEMISDGFNGFLYEPNYSSELIDILKNLISGLYDINQLSVNALETSKKYTTEILKKEYLSLLKTL